MTDLSFALRPKERGQVCFRRCGLVPAMMVTCLVIPYVNQRTKNMIPGLLTHLVLNGASQLIMIILALFGLA